MMKKSDLNNICPNCGGTLKFSAHTFEKQRGLVKTAAGTAAFGAFGLLARGRKTDLMTSGLCEDCGAVFDMGKLEKKKTRNRGASLAWKGVAIAVLGCFILSLIINFIGG